MAYEIDQHSATWKAIEAWADQRRADAVAELIQGSSRAGGDDKRRGEIRAMDDLLELARPAPPSE